MGPFAAGQVVLLPFPFSKLTRGKFRPVLLLASAGHEDWVACQITSNPYADRHAVTVTEDAFALGGLQRVSYLRPGKLFTAHVSLIAACPGSLHPAALESARDAVIAIIRGTSA